MAFDLDCDTDLDLDLNLDLNVDLDFNVDLVFDLNFDLDLDLDLDLDSSCRCRYDNLHTIQNRRTPPTPPSTCTCSSYTHVLMTHISSDFVHIPQHTHTTRSRTRIRTRLASQCTLQNIHKSAYTRSRQSHHLHTSSHQSTTNAPCNHQTTPQTTIKSRNNAFTAENLETTTQPTNHKLPRRS